jgi:hypothetical protein
MLRVGDMIHHQTNQEEADRVILHQTLVVEMQDMIENIIKELLLLQMHDNGTPQML